uniref:Hemicentin-1 (Trinotate prediction) n=1 Tax=Henneguya salminicola TaxID=69463 RepID=A0A6G3ME97_HENSL
MIPLLINPHGVINSVLKNEKINQTTTKTPGLTTPYLLTGFPEPHKMDFKPDAKDTVIDPSRWSSIIQKYPELNQHGVTESLLESIDTITPDLEGKIQKYFANTDSPNILGINSHPTEYAKFDFEQQVNNNYDSRKGMIEHFLLNNNENLVDNQSQLTWDDPNHNQWSQFTDCSQRCGIGVRMRQRNCNYPVCPSPGVETEIEPCFISSCETYGANYAISTWSPFSTCNQACGVGKSIRFRICDNVNCPMPGYETQTISCFMPKCPGIVLLLCQFVAIILKL